MNKLLAYAVLWNLSLFSSCSPAPSQACRLRYPVYLDVANLSSRDTLVTAWVAVDDSVVMTKVLPLRRSSAPHFQPALRLCDGLHQVQARVGRYVRDTTVLIRSPSALLISMDYNPLLDFNNGLTIVTFKWQGTDRVSSKPSSRVAQVQIERRCEFRLDA